MIDPDRLMVCCSAFPGSRMHVVSEHVKINSSGLPLTALTTMWSEYTLSHVLDLIRESEPDVFICGIIKKDDPYPSRANIVFQMDQDPSGNVILCRL